MHRRVYRWTTTDVPEGEEVDLSASDTDLLWMEREDAVDNVKQGRADGADRRLLRVALMVVDVKEEKVNDQ